MTTHETIEAILKLSGPFTTAAARERHRGWLERKATNELESRLRDLQDSAGRHGRGQRYLKFGTR